MNESGNDKFLIDGFPRNKNNLDGWHAKLADKVKLLFVLYFDCPLEVNNILTPKIIIFLY